MTEAPSQVPSPPAVDPHAPKLAPDDPRLRLARPGARTLRTGPIVLLVAVLFALVMLALALAFQAPRGGAKAVAQPSAAPAPPTVPDTIRNARPERSPLSSRVDAGPVERAFPPHPSETNPERQRVRELDDKALGAGIFFASAPSGPERALPEPLSRLASLEPGAPAPSAGPALPADLDPNRQDRKNAFLAGQVGLQHTDALQTTLQHPRSPYEIQAGTILPAVLLTAINSDLPGPVVAQVREHVYDSATGRYLLVPQGSRLLAQYDSMVAWGQERVLVCWNRLILPNADSIDLKCMPAADLQGAAGLADQVNEHWWRILEGASVATLLAATSAFAAGNTTGYNPTVGQVTARSASGEMNQVGTDLTRNNLNIQPTLTVRPGFSVNVIVTKDMDLPPYPDPPAALGLLP